MIKTPAVFFWSGGKDSTLALHHVLKEGIYDVKCLLTTINDNFNRVSMHGLRVELIVEQARALGIPLIEWRLPEMPNMETYELELFHQLDHFKKIGISHAIFGDIFLEDLKVYREKQLNKVGFTAVFPLWKKESLKVINEFINLGYQTIVISAQEGLQAFCGRVIDQSFLKDLPTAIDPCGENGEFHTFVFNGPLFKTTVEFELGELIFREFPKKNQQQMATGYWYIDLI